MRARLTILLSLMVVSCTNINKGNDTIVSTVIEFKPDGIEQSLAECVDSVSFLVLKENQENAFGNVDKIVVENESNTFEFFDCSMNEVAAFIRIVLDEEDRDRRPRL